MSKITKQEKMTKQQLGAKIWDAANSLRENLVAHQYKDYILGVLLYKFLCQKQTEYLIDQEFDKDDLRLFDDQLDRSRINLEDTKSVISWEEVDSKIESMKEESGYFIQHRNLFDYWVKNKQEFDINVFQRAFKNFNDVVNEIVNKYKESSHASLFKGLFSEFVTNLKTLGANAKEQTEVISRLIDIINEIPTTRQQYDVLGFIYEYLIAKFASNAGQKAGEFYTPHEVSDLISRIVAFYLQNRKEISIYDPTSGSGGLLLNIGQEFKKYNSGESPITYYAQELKDEPYNLTIMNLIMSNINSNQIHVRRGNTLENDWPLFENEDTSTYRLLTVDAVVSNPPYSQDWTPKNAGHTERFDEYGLPPQNFADYAFLLHDLYHIKPDGIGAVILPHGVLFRERSEGQIRKKLVEKGQIDAIIGLPGNMFYGTEIETVIIILKKLREERDILFVDASNLFVKDGKNNRFAKSHVKKITDIVNGRLETKISKIISFEEIEKNNFDLTISKYIELNQEKEHDLFSLLFGSISKKELKRFDSFFLNFPKIKEKMFKENQQNSDYYDLLSQDYINIIYNDSDFQNYLESFETKVRDFINFFKSKVSDINSIKNINLIELEKGITEYIFSSLKFPLIDTYDVYQIIIDNFENAKEDLELLRENFPNSGSLDIKEFLNDQIEFVDRINLRKRERVW
ncbi:type I restriction-modification system subunit M [Mesomycoplasma ovipneumoniae]|uniref:type I restriction-modification system subunit M n=1 Tax=Mesomycoplasma ovipneumoniae TaxID=29562 RepID=UPI00311CAA2B